MRRRDGGTRERLIAAAGELFAERGFRATTARDIAQRAGVNLAAANYYYGSKKELYLEVLRANFAAISAKLARSGGSRPAAEIARLGRPDLVQMLVRRVQVMLEILIGPPPGLHGALMQREMIDPSEALPLIVSEFIGPMTLETERIVARLAPSLDPHEVERCALSIIGQAVFYRVAMPSVLLRKGLKSYPRGFGPDLAQHIAEFSLGGMDRITARKTRKARAIA